MGSKGALKSKWLSFQDLAGELNSDMRLPRGPRAAKCLDGMMIATVYFAFESQSVGESRREHITIIWCMALLELGQQTLGEWLFVKEFIINQSGPSLAGAENARNPLFCCDIISGPSSISVPPHADAPGSDLLVP